MDSIIEFNDIVPIHVNEQVYYIQKQILCNSLDYFKTLFSTKIPVSEIISLDIDSRINFNIILNILMYDFYDKYIESIRNYTYDDFCEIINILMFFGAKTSIISNLIITYIITNDVPIEILNLIQLDNNNIINALKKSLIKRIDNIIANSTFIIIPTKMMHNIFNIFKISFDENDICTIKEQLSNKLFTMYNDKIAEFNLPNREFYNKTYDNSKLLTLWDINVNILNNIISEIGFKSVIKQIISMRSYGYDINIMIDDKKLITYKCEMLPFFEKYNIFNFVADYLVRNIIASFT